MNTITMDKDELLKILKDNRTKHKAEYEELVVAYVKKGAEKISELAKSFSENPLDTYLGIRVNKPDSNEKQYDLSIAMLEHDIGKTVELTQGEYQNYVNDEWSWSHAFAATKTSYGIS